MTGAPRSAGILPAVRRRRCRVFRLVLRVRTQYSLQLLLVLGRRTDKLDAGAGGSRAFHNSKQIANPALQADHAHTIAGPSDKDFVTGTQLSPGREKAAAEAETGDLIVVLTLRSPTPIGKEIYV